MLWVSPALTVYICVLTGILGACMGSFLNCMAWRIVHGESVLHGRSHCDVCGHVLGAGDLIPVLSYIMHKGRCKYCGAKLSAGHVFAEVLTALTFLLLVLKYDISLQALEYTFCWRACCSPLHSRIWRVYDPGPFHRDGDRRACCFPVFAGERARKPHGCAARRLRRWRRFTAYRALIRKSAPKGSHGRRRY